MYSSLAELTQKTEDGSVSMDDFKEFTRTHQALLHQVYKFDFSLYIDRLLVLIYVPNVYCTFFLFSTSHLVPLKCYIFLAGILHPEAAAGVHSGLAGLRKHG